MPVRLPFRLTGIAAPLAVWALHFVVVYSLQGVACGEHVLRQRVAGAELASWLLIALTLLAYAGIAALGVGAWRAWHPLHRLPQPDDTARRRRFAAAVTGLSAVLAAIAVTFTALPVLMLPPCA